MKPTRVDQARAVAALLADERVVASPLRRSCEIVERLAERLGLPIDTIEGRAVLGLERITDLRPGDGSQTRLSAGRGRRIAVVGVDEPSGTRVAP